MRAEAMLTSPRQLRNSAMVSAKLWRVAELGIDERGVTVLCHVTVSCPELLDGSVATRYFFHDRVDFFLNRFSLNESNQMEPALQASQLLQAINFCPHQGQMEAYIFRFPHLAEYVNLVSLRIGNEACHGLSQLLVYFIRDHHHFGQEDTKVNFVEIALQALEYRDLQHS